MRDSLVLGIKIGLIVGAVTFIMDVLYFYMFGGG